MINLSEPELNGNELKYLKNCINTNWLTSSGKYVKLFEEKISEFTGSKYVVSCINGTSALHLSLQILGIKENDEVIVPTLTFVATINSIIYNRANPIFFDVDNYFNIDQNNFETFIKKNTFLKNGYCYNKKTKRRIFAVVPVHVWGSAANLEKIKLLADKNNIKIVEDASESLGTFYTKGKYKNKHTGTIGQIGCLSFNGNKIVTSAGGGAILTNNKSHAENFRHLINQAKKNKIFYIHDKVGYNLGLSNVHAAIGLAQIEKIKSYLNKRKKIRSWYKRELGHGKLYDLPSYANNNCWLNVLKLEKEYKFNELNNLIQSLLKKNIETRPIWQLNHKQKIFNKFYSFNIKNANKLYNKSLCLPSSSNLKLEDIKYICKNII